MSINCGPGYIKHQVNITLIYNQPPTAYPLIFYETLGATGTSYQLPLSGTDPEGATLSYYIDTSVPYPGYGNLTYYNPTNGYIYNGLSSITYTISSLTGFDQFYYFVSDGIYDSVPAQVQIVFNYPAVQIGAGRDFTYVLRDFDRKLRTFGRNERGQLDIQSTTPATVPIPTTAYLRPTDYVLLFDCGISHAIISYNQGGGGNSIFIYGVGDNSYGQLGTATTTFLFTSAVYNVATINANSIQDVSAGGYHSAYVVGNSVFASGRNNRGQLGRKDGTTTDRGLYDNIYQDFNTVVKYGLKVSCGFEHTLILSQQSNKPAEIYACGNNTFGELNLPSTVGFTTYATPCSSNSVVFGTGFGVGTTNAIDVAAGYYHSIVLLDNGTIATFGRNNRYQLGTNINTTFRNIPTILGPSSFGGSSPQYISAGMSHSAVIAGGRVWMFGDNSYRQLGVTGGVVSSFTSIPVVVPGISNAVSVECGENHTVVLLSNGRVMTFGNNQYGALGNNYNASPSATGNITTLWSV
jgi:alpha-tubulin suppressor-like RCC1 family protein